MMLEELFWKEGPGCFAGRPIILKFWHPKPKETHRWIPLWVKLYNVPVELWSPSGFSHIASAIGRPLHADSITESMQKVSFARICIEVDASKPLLDKFEVEISKDVFVEIHAFYQCKPKQCLTCLDTLTTNVQSPLKELEEGKQILETFEILPQLPPSTSSAAPVDSATISSQRNCPTSSAEQKELLLLFLLSKIFLMPKICMCNYLLTNFALWKRKLWWRMII